MDAVHLWKSYGSRLVLRDLSFSAPPGVTCIEAPSGGGKTTLLRIVLGLEKADRGRVEGLEGARLAAVFQEDRLLLHATALENLAFVRPGAEEASAELLEELGLSHLAYERCDALSYGQQKKLEIVRAMASAPKLLLLDEPAAGLNPLESEELSVFVAHLIDRGFTILLIEHDISLVMSISDYVYVMDHGRMLSEGMPEQVQRDPAVIEAYIGKRGMQDVIAGKSP